MQMDCNSPQPNQCLRYTAVGHAEGLLKNLYTLRSAFCDAAITVGSETFTAHCIILSACSEYFKVMFCGGLSESFSKQVELHGIEARVFSSLLEFIYTGEIDITSENVRDLLPAADMLQILDVKQACCNFIRSLLHPSNCLKFHELASTHSCVELYAACGRYTNVHFLQVVQHEEFNRLECSELLVLLRSENLQIQNELQVFRAALKWILYDVTQREEYLVQILEPVRFPIISSEELFDCIEQQCNNISIKGALGALLADYNPKAKFKLKKSSNLPPDLKMKPRLCARKHLYVIGGYISGSRIDIQLLDIVERLDLFSQIWTLPDILIEPCSSPTVTLDGVIYVIGGVLNGYISNSVKSFDPLEGKLVPNVAMTLTAPRGKHGSCVLNGVIYVFGGCTQTGEMCKTIEYYSRESQQWIEAGKILSPRTNFGFVESEGLIYLFGGNCALETELRSVECYNPVTKETTALPDMRSTRARCSAVVIDDNIYVVGGSNKKKASLNSVEKYSILNEKWTSIPCMSTSRAGAAAATASGILYVVGGCTHNCTYAASYLDTVECYDPVANIWTNIEEIAVARADMAIAVL